ncbi:unnamed protein product [Rhizophagus irregularis]|nr:unnamed protein product [Rhizophagus irregularis]
MSLLDDDIRVVVSIDFGTTYSGYAYAHKSNPNEIIVQENWEGLEGHYKTPTVIKYDEKLTKDKFSRNLKFTTEPEAAAIYCLNSMKGQYNLSTGV